MIKVKTHRIHPLMPATQAIGGVARLDVATFYTVESIQLLLDKWRREGTCANGLYMYDPSWVVIREITRESLKIAIEDMIATDAIQHAMQ